MSTSLSREVFGIRFSNPLLLASGTAGYGLELEGVMDLDRLGGIVTKAVSLAPRAGNRPPRVAEFRGGMLNSVGLANPGLAALAANELPALVRRFRGRGPRVVVNVVGFEEAEYAGVVAGLEVVEGVDAYELNLSCPNTAAGGLEFGADAGAVRRVVAGCRAATRRPIVAKLSPAVPDLPSLAAAAVEAGADGVTLVNTMPGLAYHEDGRTRLGQGNGGVSGPALLPVGLLAVRRVRERLPDTPILGVGGIRTATDVRDYLRAGATLVQVGTAALADPRAPARILAGLERTDG
ncbi:MAG TPA: dihydroorotate dehydrogenase [Gemmatimonadales bacterium]|nr:dihydroorotate dehydrogenase [Gemmatimonadales bacterium]